MELDGRRDKVIRELEAGTNSVKRNETRLIETESDLEAIEQDMGPEALAEIKEELEKELAQLK